MSTEVIRENQFGGLDKSLSHLKLPELTNVELSETKAIQKFKRGLNEGELFPVGIELSSPEAGQEMAEFESQVNVFPITDVQTQEEQLKKLFERFTPNVVCDTPDYLQKFNKFLEERGYTSDTSIKKQLQNTGSIFYFPVGVSTKGKLQVEKRRFFPEAVQYEILTASEWELLSPEAKNKLRNSHLTAVGLSVGSQNVEAALLAGVTSFDIADPTRLHTDAQGRLGDFGYDERFLGVNKTAMILYKIMERYPYADIKAFYDGLTIDNKDVMFDSEKMEKQEGRGIWFVSEEADNFDAKALTRQGIRALPEGIEWHVIMIGDVGHRAAFFHETKADEPFLGFLRKIDPNKNPYGRGVVEKYDSLMALFASIGGFEGIPEPLLSQIAEGKIGNFPQAKITRVPQSREATLLTGAVFSGALRLIAEGKPVTGRQVLDLRQSLSISPDSKKQEQALQKIMNEKMFGFEEF